MSSTHPARRRAGATASPAGDGARGHERCPVCGQPPRTVFNKVIVFKVARWAVGLPHVAEELRCQGEPAHTWEVFEVTQ